jgi:NTP pyrophosphatase (non-canonical NTP hydrolase)
MSDESKSASPNQPSPDVLSELMESVAKFCEERDWDQYHDAKELAIGLVTESAELLDHFRFKSAAEFESFFDEASGAAGEAAGKREDVEDELADILFFVLRFSGRYKIDLASALRRKLEKNALKYPIEKSRGSNRKYDEL